MTYPGNPHEMSIVDRDTQQTTANPLYYAWQSGFLAGQNEHQDDILKEVAAFGYLTDDEGGCN